MRLFAFITFAAFLITAFMIPGGALANRPLVIHSEQEDFKLYTVTEGLEHPWSVAFLPGGGFLVTERGGTLWRVAPGGGKTKITGLPENIIARRQGGLLDVALHPDFAANKWVYMSYTGRGQGGTSTEVARGQLEGDRLENLETIFIARPKMRSDVHFGSRLLFTPDGYLFITLGERFDMNEAQNPANHLGTIIRLYDDGRVPEDNPFAGDPGKKPEIFSYGHRNVQGIALEPGTGTVWAHEHGPQGGDEVNILRSGANYGWPEITYGIDYDDTIISDKTHMDGMEQPQTYWTPSIAPSGMAFYDGDQFPAWRGDIFVGALAGAHLRRLESGNLEQQEILLKELGERIRDVRAGPDGYLYILTDSYDGRLMRLEPAQ